MLRVPGSKIYGESKPYWVALVSLDGKAIKEGADRNRLEGKSFADVAGDEKTKAMIGRAHRNPGQASQPVGAGQTLRVIDRELTLEAGDLTPSPQLYG